MSKKLKLEVAFGRVVRQQRQQLGISQEALAELAGLHRTYISQVERGVKSPSLKTLMTLATALQTSASNLLLQMEGELGSD